MVSCLKYGQLQNNNGGFMKKVVSIIMVSLLIMSMSTVIYAADEHVVCEIDVRSEQSAVVTLNWSKGSDSSNIQMAGWRADGGTLYISYRINNGLSSRMNKRTIESPDYQFPMRIVLINQDDESEVFTDLTESNRAYDSILNLYYQGVINGYPTGDFRPENLVQRSEFSKMVTLAAGYNSLTDVDSSFPDMAVGHWAEDYVMTLSAKGILVGYPNGNFGIADNITIGAVLKVIDETFNFYEYEGKYPYDLADNWSNGYFESLVAAGIVNTSDTFYHPYTPNAKATRAQCAELLSRAMEKLSETK